MSLSGALNNALSGLYMNSRRSAVVATNISNAQTPGFGRRSLEISTGSITGGVRVDGVRRFSDPALINDRRLSSAAVASQGERAEFLARFEGLIGSPDVGYSLAGRLATFENAIITAASRPDAVERLDGAVIAAKSLAQTLSNASKDIQDSREQADASINTQVETLNSTLKQIEKVDRLIRESGGNKDLSGLRDQRQILIDGLSEMIPVRLATRDNDALAIYTTGGAIIFDGTASEFEFEQTHVIEAELTVDPGVLSGLTLDGRPIGTSSDSSSVRGGSLIAQFAIRDEMAVEAQEQLDAVARDLIERFEDVSEDTTRPAGSPGLFTDQGSAMVAADELGLASRIRINASVDIDNGGESWRLRDGLNAGSPGDVGNATLLHAYSDTINQHRTPASGNFGGGQVNLSGLAATLSSQVGSQRLFADQDLSFAAAQLAELTQREYAEGVDTDTELQNLMIIEQAYAANARILETVDELLQTIIRI